MGKIAIRNIDDAVLEALQHMAALNDRSTEGEARQAIRVWVAPLLEKNARSMRCKEIAERLTVALRQTNSARKDALTPSKIAESIHEDRAEDAENWFQGSKEPSFDQLDSMAMILRVDPDWLKHGCGTPYPIEQISLPEDPFVQAEWLFQPPKGKNCAENYVYRLHVLRTDDPKGDITIVKELSDGSWSIHEMGISLPEEPSKGDVRQISIFAMTMDIVSRLYSLHVTKNVRGSSKLDARKIALLKSGMCNPASLIKDDGCSPLDDELWWQIFYDSPRVKKRDYWPGCLKTLSLVEETISKSQDLLVQKSNLQNNFTKWASAKFLCLPG